MNCTDLDLYIVVSVSVLCYGVCGHLNKDGGGIMLIFQRATQGRLV